MQRLRKTDARRFSFTRFGNDEQREELRKVHHAIKHLCETTNLRDEHIVAAIMRDMTLGRNN